MTVLEELWYGNVYPQGAILNESLQFKHLLSLMDRNRDKLAGTLTEQQKELLEKYDDVINEMHSLAEQTAFQYGVSFGIRLMMECLEIRITKED